MTTFGIRRDRNACFIAEIGLNHNGDMETARRMIHAAAGAGADAVKFQTFVPELMASAHAASLLATGREGKPDSYLVDFFSRFILTRGQYLVLKREADELGVVFFSSPFDNPSVDLLEEIGVPWYKVASSEVTNHPLLKRIASTGKPVILSTGICAEEEIAGALDILRGGGGPVVLLHCVSLYPLPPAKANLNRIGALRGRFNCPVGFSDHTPDGSTAVLAAAAGARYFEKHFALDGLDCPDAAVSLTPEPFRAMVSHVTAAIESCGTGAISSGADEADVARGARRSLFARRSIPAGTVISEGDLVALRPGVGISPKDMPVVLGRRTVTSIPEGYLIREEHFETDERKSPRQGR